MFEKRRLKRAQATFEADRATWDLLGEVTVSFEDLTTAAVSERWTDGLTDDELDWLGIYLGVAYVPKMMFNLVGMPEIERLWNDVRTGAIRASSPSLRIVPETPTPIALFQAQAYRKPDRDVPFLQSPTVADGDEGVLAHHAVAAVLGQVQSRSAAQATRIEHGLNILMGLFDADAYDPNDIESMRVTPYVVMSVLEDEGHLASGTFKASE